MGPEEVAFIKAVVIAVLGAGAGFAFYALRLRHRSQLPAGVHSDEEARQRAFFEARIAELEERVDFMERHLTEARSEAPRIEPRVPTPV